MSTRLGPRDMALLAMESSTSPMHHCTLEVFDPAESGFDYAVLCRLISERIAFVPRYRQRLQTVPGGLANPQWLDDPDFDLNFHVRRSAVPAPGSMDQLRELVARIISRPLDRSRSPWEVYVIEGLAQGRVAILSKSHQVLVDGVETVDLGQVLLDNSPEPKILEHDDWHPGSRPTWWGATAAALSDTVADPWVGVQTMRTHLDRVGRIVGGVAHGAGVLAGGLSGRHAPESPINADLSSQRRFVTVSTDLADYRAIREVHGGTVNDLILATITGALRSWLMTRSESLGGRRTLRAMVPMSVIDDELEATSLGTQIAGHLVDLPIGEPSAVVRLHQVSYAFKAHTETGRAVAANRLAGIAGFAPTTFHALGSRLAALQARRGFHLNVINVPGPQFPLYAAGARMVESFPVHPLLPGHALSIGVTSYDGKVSYGITADRDALPDVEVLGQCLVESLEELRESAAPTRKRAPRGRRPHAKERR